MSLTRSLLAAAVVATSADIAAYVLLVAPGIAVELNPIVARMDSAAAVAARLALIVVLGALVIVAEAARSRLLTAWLSIVLATAVVVGVLGTAATLGSIR